MAIQRLNLGTAPTGVGGDTERSAFKKIDDNFGDSANACSRLVGTASDNVMEVGAFGFGGRGKSGGAIASLNDLKNLTAEKSQIIRAESGGLLEDFSPAIYLKSGDTNIVLSFNALVGTASILGWANSDADFRVKYKLLTNKNTSVDANGFIKAASPIVQLYADKIEINDDAKKQSITFLKNGVGDYLIKGSQGFAKSGWYIETPKDANGNVLVAIVYETLENGDISVKTYAKKFDDETGDVIANIAKPRDIPVGRWIDLRLNELSRLSDVK